MVYKISQVDGEDEHDTLKDLHSLTFFGSAALPNFQNGYWWVAYEGKDAVAFAGITPSSLGPNIGYMKRVGVLQGHRGQGLHRRLTRVREAKAKRLGWVRVVTDTTSNPNSANNLIKAGYKMFTPKTGGWAFPESCYWTKTIQ